MKVEVLSGINSGQAERGDIIILPDAEAKRLIEQGVVKRCLVGKESAKLESPMKAKEAVSEARAATKKSKGKKEG